MRFRRIRAAGFGPLELLDTGEDDLGSLVAVLGPNEAGKSSFHQAAVALLYGFYPATRDTHPFAPWNGAIPELTGWVETADGDLVEVHRRLLSRPDGRLTVGDRVETIGNRALVQMAHVRHEIFEQVYAITLSDLAGLEREGWGAVQDRLVVGMGTSDLRAPRQAIEALEAEALRLWRADRRGKPRFRELRDELGTLRELRRAAAGRDRELRELDRSLDELERKSTELRNHRSRLREERARVARLQPLVARLQHLDELAAEAGEPQELTDLPPDPAAALRNLDERLDELEARGRRLTLQAEDAEARGQGPGTRGADLLPRMGELRALADRAGVLQERAAGRGRLDAEIVELDRRIRETAAPLFEDPAPDPEVLSALPLPRLKEGLDELERARRELEAARETLRTVEARALPERDAALPAGALAAIAIGLLLLLAGLLPGLLPGPPPQPGGDPGGGAGGLAIVLVLLGSLALIGGAMGAAGWRTRREIAAEAARSGEQERRALEDRIRRLETERTRARREVGEILDPLPLRAQVRKAPGTELARELERLRDRVLDRGGREAMREGIRREDEEVERAIRRLRGELPSLADLPMDPVAALPELGRRLDEARRAGEAARAASIEATRLRDELGEVQVAVDALKDRRRKLCAAILHAAGGGRSGELDGQTPTASELERVRRRLDARQAHERGTRELRAERTDLAAERDELRAAEAAGEGWIRDPDAPARIDAELGRLDEEMEDLQGELERSRERFRSLEREETVDLVDSRILAVEAELERVARERDRLFLLARLIRVAEARFRETHQPDLLRRAGEHLARITDGRYERFRLSEEGGEAPFLLDAAHLPHPHAVEPPLSTGIREQAYLALRLAIVDHLDRDRDPLPLFLDEVLVNWDDERRSRGLDLLREAAGARQIFLFTCHPGLAQAVESRGGQLIELPAPEPVG